MFYKKIFYVNVIDHIVFQVENNKLLNVWVKYNLKNMPDYICLTRSFRKDIVSVLLKDTIEFPDFIFEIMK